MRSAKLPAETSALAGPLPPEPARWTAWRERAVLPSATDTRPTRPWGRGHACSRSSAPEARPPKLGLGHGPGSKRRAGDEVTHEGLTRPGRYRQVREGVEACLCATDRQPLRQVLARDAQRQVAERPRRAARTGSARSPPPSPPHSSTAPSAYASSVMNVCQWCRCRMAFCRACANPSNWPTPAYLSRTPHEEPAFYPRANTLVAVERPWRPSAWFPGSRIQGLFPAPRPGRPSPRGAAPRTARVARQMLKAMAGFCCERSSPCVVSLPLRCCPPC